MPVKPFISAFVYELVVHSLVSKVTLLGGHTIDGGICFLPRPLTKDCLRIAATNNNCQLLLLLLLLLLLALKIRMNSCLGLVHPLDHTHKRIK